jgi:ankyrin repeat protein
LVFSARAQPAGCGEELFDAAADGDLEAVLLLLDLGAPTEWADEYGSRALHGTSNRAVAEALLLCGAEVDARMDDQSTPLINAAYSGRSDVLPALLVGGADAAAQDEDDMTALDHAREECNRGCVAVLEAWAGGERDAAALAVVAGAAAHTS